MAPYLPVLIALITVALCTSACSNWPKSKAERSPDELFRLRAECANQARQFETDWRRQLGPEYGFSVFQNHYNEGDGRCYVHILAGNAFGHHETVMDATEGIGGPERAWRKVLTDKAPVKPEERNTSSEHDDSKTIARIRQLMGGVPGNSVMDQLVQKQGGR